MNTYVVSGTIRYGDYCDCSHCQGHFQTKEVTNQVVNAETEDAAFEAVLDDALLTENFDEAEWKKGASIVVIEREVDGGKASDVLLPAPPEKLLKKAQTVGVVNYWIS